MRKKMEDKSIRNWFRKKVRYESGSTKIRVLSQRETNREISYFEELLPLNGRSNIKKKKYETFPFCKIDQFSNQ
jgi:hypothetical protein